MASKKKGVKKEPGGETPLMLMFELAAIHERLLSCITDDEIRTKWDTEIEAQMELIFQSIKEPDDG